MPPRVGLQKLINEPFPGNARLDSTLYLFTLCL